MTDLDLEKQIAHILGYCLDTCDGVSHRFVGSDDERGEVSKLTALCHTYAQQARVDELERFMDWDRWDELGQIGNEAISVKQIMERLEFLRKQNKERGGS